MYDSDILSLRGITKIYGNGIVANHDVNFSVRKGEIHALIGENGAGKTTLMKILYGIEQADRGDILINDEVVTISSPKDAISHGIGMVQQHFQLVPSLTVAENLVLGREPHHGMLFDRMEAEKICEEYSKLYNLPVDPTKQVRDISVSEKQKLEILKALLGGAKILILDEPTAVLTPQEISVFFDQLKLLKEKGHTIIFISHRLNELLEISDRMTVIRAGRTIGTYETHGCNAQHISKLIVGRDVVLKVEKDPPKPGKTILAVNNLTVRNSYGKKAVDDISFTVRSGEIVGIAAVEGNGQKEVVDAITGTTSYSHGSITLDGIDINSYSPKKLREKMSYISEDRNTVGSARDSSIQDNLITLRRSEKALYSGAFLSRNALKNLCDRMIEEYEIKCDGKDSPMSMLSGGNAQKVVVAREVDREPELLVAQQPTRGVDVGSVEFIHKQIVKKRDEGSAILLISADLGEVISLSDSLIVMHNGKISAYFPSTAELSEEDVGAYMLGLEPQSEEMVRKAYHEE